MNTEKLKNALREHVLEGSTNLVKLFAFVEFLAEKLERDKKIKDLSAERKETIERIEENYDEISSAIDKIAEGFNDLEMFIF